MRYNKEYAADTCNEDHVYIIFEFDSANCTKDGKMIELQNLQGVL